MSLSKVHAFHQAAKLNGRWVYSPFRRRPVGPFHPANKPSLICVTRSGHIRLVYQNPDSKWAQISAELKNTGYSDRLLTHAAIAATPGGCLSPTHPRRAFLPLLLFSFVLMKTQLVFLSLRTPRAGKSVFIVCSLPGTLPSGIQARASKDLLLRLFPSPAFVSSIVKSRCPLMS